MKIDITIPESLADIKLRDYQKFVKIQGDNKDKDDLFIRQKMVQIFCNVPLLTVSKMKRKDFLMISNALIHIMEERPKLTPTTELNGIKYGFIPNLDNDLSLGEFVDLGSYMENWYDYHKAMGVLYRPITVNRKGKYLIEKYDASEKYSSAMLDMPMDIVLGSVFFFVSLTTRLLRITPKYLRTHLAKNPEATAALEKNGVGISTFTRLLGEACLKWEMLLPHTLAQP